MKDFSKAEKIVLVPDISGSMRPNQYRIEQNFEELRHTVKFGDEAERAMAKLKLNCEYGPLIPHKYVRVIDLHDQQIKILDISKAGHDAIMELADSMQAHNESVRLIENQKLDARRFKQSKSRLRRGPGLYWRNR